MIIQTEYLSNENDSKRTKYHNVHKNTLNFFACPMIPLQRRFIKIHGLCLSSSSSCHFSFFECRLTDVVDAKK